MLEEIKRLLEAILAEMKFANQIALTPEKVVPIPVPKPVEKEAPVAKMSPVMEQALTGKIIVKAEAPAQTAEVTIGPETAPAVTYNEVGEAIVKLAGKGGRDRCFEILKQFGAATVPALKPEQYAAVLALVNDALKAISK